MESWKGRGWDYSGTRGVVEGVVGWTRCKAHDEAQGRGLYHGMKENHVNIPGCLISREKGPQAFCRKILVG